MAKFSSSLSNVNSNTVLIIIVISLAIIFIVYFLNNKQECFANPQPKTQPQTPPCQFTSDDYLYDSSLGARLNAVVPTEAGLSPCNPGDKCVYDNMGFECYEWDSSDSDDLSLITDFGGQPQNYWATSQVS